MHYQVVARPDAPDSRWTYYPYWAPGRDATAAERLAKYAAQNGYEAAVIHSVTLEMLDAVTRRVVERQDARMLSTTRYLPRRNIDADRQRRLDQVAAPASSVLGRSDHDAQRASTLDRRRLELELGTGGDVTKATSWQPYRVTLPRRMVVISEWLSIRGRLQDGRVGGPADGTAT